MRRALRRFIADRAPRLTREIERLMYLRRAPRLIVSGSPAALLPERVAAFSEIPGMLPLDQCIRLYFMAYGSAATGGDIIEIGSWQGRSTVFLAQACQDSDKGVVHAIDHFRGNPGKEHLYRASADDLSDLEAVFRSNIERVGLANRVRLHAADAEEVVGALCASSQDIRLLFIDGEHTAEAVRRDISSYAPLLRPGGLIVFDDYSPQFPEYARAVEEEVVESDAFVGAVAYERTLVARKR